MYVHVYNCVVVKPNITSNCSNVTVEVGLPVTLTCYVEGDPKHYWVGWMSKNTFIHAGDEHSISTSPSFKSLNGTAHHLTIHSVKVSGKYECTLYNINGDIQDQVTHHVIVNEGKNFNELLTITLSCCLPVENHEDTMSPTSSPSLLKIISSLLF